MAGCTCSCEDSPRAECKCLYGKGNCFGIPSKSSIATTGQSLFIPSAGQVEGDISASGSGGGAVNSDEIEISFTINDDWTAYGGGVWEYFGRFDGESYNSGLPIPAYRGALTIFRIGTDEHGRS